MTIAILSMILLGTVGVDVEATKERKTFLYITTSPPGAEVQHDCLSRLEEGWPSTELQGSPSPTTLFGNRNAPPWRIHGRDWPSPPSPCAEHDGNLREG